MGANDDIDNRLLPPRGVKNVDARFQTPLDPLIPSTALLSTAIDTAVTLMSKEKLLFQIQVWINEFLQT